MDTAIVDSPSLKIALQNDEALADAEEAPEDTADDKAVHEDKNGDAAATTDNATADNAATADDDDDDQDEWSEDDDEEMKELVQAMETRRSKTMPLVVQICIDASDDLVAKPKTSQQRPQTAPNMRHRPRSLAAVKEPKPFVCTIQCGEKTTWKALALAAAQRCEF